MYRQLVEKEHEFEPAEPLPLLAWGIGLGLLGGVGAVLWRRRAREILRLEREAERLRKRRQYVQAISTLNNAIELEELEVMDLEAKLEVERLTKSRDLNTMKRLLVGIRRSKAKLATLNVSKNSLEQARRNQRRVHRLRRRLRQRSH